MEHHTSFVCLPGGNAREFSTGKPTGGLEQADAVSGADLLILLASDVQGKNQNQFPSLENAETRPDILGIWVSDAASKSRWFKDKLKILMADSGWLVLSKMFCFHGFTKKMNMMNPQQPSFHKGGLRLCFKEICIYPLTKSQTQSGGLCAFFLDSMNESAERRLCFAGRKLEENCHDVENNDAIAQTLEKTRVAVDFVLGKDRRRQAGPG